MFENFNMGSLFDGDDDNSHEYYNANLLFI
jgi:hypothetical protein